MTLVIAAPSVKIIAKYFRKSIYGHPVQSGFTTNDKIYIYIFVEVKLLLI